MALDARRLMMQQPLDSEGSPMLDEDGGEAGATPPRVGGEDTGVLPRRLAKFGAAAVGLLGFAAVAAAMATQRGSSSSAAARSSASDIQMLHSQMLFDCNSDEPSPEVSWSLSKKVYCCSHFKIGCPDQNTVSATFVLSNLKYKAIVEDTGSTHDALKTAIKEELAELAGGNVTKDDIGLHSWEGSGIYSTTNTEGSDGVVYRATIEVNPPDRRSEVIAHLNKTDVLAEKLEKKVRQVTALSSYSSDVIEVKSVVVEMKLVDECTCMNGEVATGDLCPAFGGEICSSCEHGYVLSDGHVCMENKCECADGFAAEQGGCPKSGARWCASCFSGFHLMQVPSEEERLCVNNTCHCTNGEAATGAMCGQDEALLCSVCDDGYHLDENLRCKENECVCTDGEPAEGLECTRHGASICKKCEAGFHVDEHDVCMRNTCKCHNGQVALGPLCHTDGGEVCAYCYGEEEHLRKDGSCGDKECLCPNGTPVDLKECTTHHSIVCERCDDGFVKNSNQCVSSGCACENGVAASGKTCPSPGAHKCVDCHSGFTLEEESGQCKPNICDCANGTAAIGGGCRVSGSISCAACDPGFHIELENVKDDEGTKLAVECEPNICECENGKAATYFSSPVCHSDGSNICAECTEGYHLEESTDKSGRITGHQCVLNECRCHQGTPVGPGECKVHKGMDCAKCDNGFFLAKEPLYDFEEGAGYAPPKKELFTGDNMICASSKLTTSLAFDCQSALAKWESAWSKVKKRWCCQNQQLGCHPEATQKDLCEGHNFSLEQCDLVGCCVFDAASRTCKAAVDDGGDICHPEYNMKTASGSCVTAIEHHQGAVVTRSLVVKPCDPAESSQDWAPASPGAGMSQIQDVMGLCITIVNDEDGGKLTAEPCAAADGNPEVMKKQLISFIPLVGQQSTGFLKSKSDRCITVEGGVMQLAGCNPADMNQQFTAEPLHASVR